MPEGLVVDSAWLTAHGYSNKLRAKYVAAGWLQQPARRVYQRDRGPLAWQQVVVSLQTLLGLDIVVAGLSALEYHGFGHYLRHSTATVHLTGPDRPPTWLDDLLPDVEFRYRNDVRLFDKQRASTAPHTLRRVDETSSAEPTAGLHVATWGAWNWPLVVATPERAILELVNALPDGESFHQVDMVMESLTTLGPRKLNTLLADCRSVRAKRLFLFFAERHKHTWFKHLDRAAIDLGHGKRMIAKGGTLDPTYLITVPRDLDAH